MKIPFTNYEIRASTRPRPDDWNDFWYQGEAYSSKSGIDISEDLCLQEDTVKSCVTLISEDLAKLPLHIYRRRGRSRDRAEDHPLDYLLNCASNPEMTSMEFRSALQAHLLTWGNAYAEIERDLRGQIKALWPLNPSKMTVTRPGNEIIYEYLVEDGQKRMFSRDDIFHISGLGFNGLVGYSPISLQHDLISVSLAAQEWQSTNFKNNGRLQLAFSHPGVKAPNKEGRENFKKEIRKEYGGPSGESIAVLWEGMKVEPISMTMADAQFVENWKFIRARICGIYRVPPHKIGILDNATFTNIEHQGLDYVDSALSPWGARWEKAIDLRLLNGNGMFFAEHVWNKLIQGDTETRNAAYAVGRSGGWLSANDIREKENMNPIEGGDTYLQPLNMTKLGEFPEPSPQPEQITEVEESERAIKTLIRLKLAK
jgi:HK97 family phage portal protein